MPTETETETAELREALTELLEAWSRQPKGVLYPAPVELWLRQDMKPALYKARVLVETLN